MTTATIHSKTPSREIAAGPPWVQRLDPAPHAVDVFRRLAALPHVLFLDSAMRHHHLGRYSFVAADPVEWLSVPADGRDALGSWQRRLASTQIGLDPHLPPFQGGWAGLFSYDLARGLEAIPAAACDEFQTPALAVGLYDVVVAFDHYAEAAWIVSQGLPEVEPAACRERAAMRLQQFHAILRNSDCGLRNHIQSAIDIAPQYDLPCAPGLTSNFSPEGYRRMVRRAIDYIRAGDVFQVNLAQRLLHPAIDSPIELYCRLRQHSPAPFAAYFDAGTCQIASASPERFLKVQNGHVETRPIKGTRRREASAAADRAAADALRSSAKDRSENVMIVDLLRNDLSRTCAPDNVRVTQLCGLESYASVHHLVSAVEGNLRDECTPLDLMRTCFPGGSVTGAPKVRAMEIIAELEPTARGAYCGALGYLSAGGHMDTSILIRTITASHGWWQLPVGGGIVAQSDADEEYAETWHKAESLLRALA
jgi:para-aminobenzoate synthetase component 1